MGIMMFYMVHMIQNTLLGNIFVLFSFLTLSCAARKYKLMAKFLPFYISLHITFTLHFLTSLASVSKLEMFFM